MRNGGDQVEVSAERGEGTAEAVPMAMPLALRLTVTGAILFAMAGALYVILVRGEALLIELGKFGRVFCL
jgi:hypothetical protein